MPPRLPDHADGEDDVDHGSGERMMLTMMMLRMMLTMMMTLTTGMVMMKILIRKEILHNCV